MVSSSSSLSWRRSKSSGSCSGYATRNDPEEDDRCGWLLFVIYDSSKRRRRQELLLLLLFLCSILSQALPHHSSVEALSLSRRPPPPHNNYRCRRHLLGVDVRGGAGAGHAYNSRSDHPSLLGSKATLLESSGFNNNDNDNNNNNNNNTISLNGLLPPDFPRWDDVTTAVHAVRKACAVTVALQPVNEDAFAKPSTTTSSSSSSTTTIMTKDDASPVTVADLAVQAVVLHHLRQHFPTDGFIAEEDSTQLRQQQQPALCQRVADAAQLTPEQVLDAIDAGKSYLQWTLQQQQQQPRPRRVWCLDPIDGTRGFLRGRRTGGQYAVALALLQDGIPVIGVLGCPNLPHSDLNDDLAWSDTETDISSSEHRGCLFVASQGGGCYQLTVPSAPAAAMAQDSAATTTTSSSSTTTTTAATPRRLQVTSQGCIHDARFCIGVESYSDAQGQTVSMARLLHGPEGVVDNHNIVRARRMDSQAKHGIVARGGAEWYVRLPRPGYVEWIWDHAAGFVVATEAGGTVTDTHGRPLDFSLGPQLSPDVQGVLMSCGGAWHDALVQAYAAVVNDAAAAAAGDPL